MALPPNYYGGSAVPAGTQPFNKYSGTQGTYGYGLGMPIQQFGQANPYGPYSGLSKATTGGGMPTAGGGSSTSTTGNADAEAWLKNVMAGNNLPFSPQQQAAMLTQQSDMGAAAESARNGQLDANAAASGSSGRDPSLQGAKAANFAARQVGNQRAAGDIATKANSANFGAQMNAAETLNNNAMTRASWQQSGGGASGFLPWNAGRGTQSTGGNNFQGSHYASGLTGQFGNNYETNRADPYGTGTQGYRYPWQQQSGSAYAPGSIEAQEDAEYQAGRNGGFAAMGALQNGFSSWI